MMRITNNMMVSTLMNNLERNLNRMSVYQDQLATGKRIIRASDDPVGTSKVLKFKSDIAALAQYEKNTGDSLAWLEVTESSIADTGSVLQRIRELAVQAANGTNTNEELQKIAMEVEQMKKHLISNGNFNYAGRYAFSGYQTDIPLFNEDGTYRIDVTQADILSSPKLQYQVSIAQEMDVTTSGLDVYGVETSAAPYILETTLPSGVNGVSTNGVMATKSYLEGSFSLTTDYSADILDITVGGVTFAVNEATLAGSAATPLTQQQVVEAFNGAVNGVSRLSDVADVYYNAAGNLVIKAKAFGPVAVTETSLLFNPPVSTTGVATGEASVTGTFVITDAYVAANAAELKDNALYLSVNGERKRIQIDPSAVLMTAADLDTALQTAIDAAFGAGRVGVAITDGAVPAFSTLNSPDGTQPTISTEYIVAKESALIADINRFVTALNTGDVAGISTFLSNVDIHMNRILSVRADIGARVNRMELIANRIADNSISFTKMLSDAYDADMAGVIMFLKNSENVYKAALSTGSKVIQPTLIDFLR